MTMKKLFLMFILLLVFTFGFQNAFAENYSNQYNLPQHAITQFGKGRISDMAYSPNGHRLAVSANREIWIYDAHTGEEIDVLLGHTKGIESIEYSPDGSTLASASGDGTVRVWDATTTQLKTVIGIQKSAEANPYAGNWFRKVTYSPDGLMLATSSRDGVQLWDAATGTHKVTLTEDNDHSRDCLAFSPDGKTLASVDFTKIFLWDIASGTRKATLEREGARVLSLAFSPDGKDLWAVTTDGPEKWDPTVTGRQLREEWHSSWDYKYIAYSPDSSRIAIGSKEGIEVWNFRYLENDQWDWNGSRKLIRAGFLPDIEYSPDGHSLASTSGDGMIRIWNPITKQLKAEWVFSPVFTSVAYSPDGGTLASRSDGAIHLWDAVTGNLKTTIRAEGVSIGDMMYSPDGKMLAHGIADTVRLWDAVTGNLKTTIRAEGVSIGDIVYSPDGRTLAIAGEHTVDPSKDIVHLWNTATGNLKTTIQASTTFKYYRIWYMAYSPDGRTLAIAGRDSQPSQFSGDWEYLANIRLWDTATGNLKTTIEVSREPNAIVDSIVYSPDGSTLAIGKAGDLTLWDVVKRASKGHLRIPSCRYFGVAFSPDGSVLVSGGSDSLLHIWDSVTGERKDSLIGHSESIFEISFSPDGRTLASVSYDGLMLLWDLTEFITQQPQDMVRLVYFRPKDRSSHDLDATLDTLITETQQFYAEQMHNHGHGRKTFTFETDANGNTVVHYMEGQFTDAYYQQQTYEKVGQEISNKFDISKNVYLAVVDVSSQSINEEYCGIGGGDWWEFPEALRRDHEGSQRDVGGLAVIPASGVCFNVRVTAHELGHAFGLDHDFRDDTYLMAYGTQQRLSDSNAEWLGASRFFNTAQAFFNQPTTIQMLSGRAAQPQFKITDADGLHQVQLLIPTTADDLTSGRKLHSSKALNGQTDSTVELVATGLPEVPSVEVTVKVIDRRGYITERTFQVVTGTGIPVDVNADGAVNIQDLVLVASRLGQAGQNKADVNGDGAVNIQDLVLVAGELGTHAAAPSAWHHTAMGIPTRATVEQWLTQAHRLSLTDARSQRGILLLERLLATLAPEETALLTNYPNPFNPETWIPYHLAAPAEVTLTIYAIDGRVVRHLDLGHQDAGYYQSKARAAYWDGRNNVGERVASGIYFYTLTVGDFAATKKLLIRK